MTRVLIVLTLFLLVAGVPTAHAGHVTTQVHDIHDTGDASRLVASLATRARIISYEPGLTASSRRARLLDNMENRFAFA